MKSIILTIATLVTTIAFARPGFEDQSAFNRHVRPGFEDNSQGETRQDHYDANGRLIGYSIIRSGRDNQALRFLRSLDREY